MESSSDSESDKLSSSSDESFDTEESFDDDKVGIEASNNNDSEKEIVNNIVVDAEHEENETEVESIEGQTELVWKDTKLFPPERSKSDVWKFGGFAKDQNGKLLKERVICSLCGKKIHYANSPTNFRTHLNDKHGSIVKSVYNKTSTNQPKITMFGKSFIIKKYKGDHPKQKKFRQLLNKWIIKDKRSLGICEDIGFRDIMELADNQLSVPSRRTVTREIKSLFSKKRKETKEKFSKIDYFSCTNDAGTSLAGHSFIDVNVHWINDDFECERKVVDVKAIHSKKAPNYRKSVDDTLDIHGIKEKVFSFTTDNEPTMQKTFSKVERNGCFPHIESKATQYAANSSETLKKLRKKLRKIVGKSKKSSKFLRQVAIEQTKRGLKERTLKQEVPTRFTSTHIMIRSFLNDPNEKSEDEIDVDKAKMNIEAVNKALKVCVNKDQYEKLEITEADFKVLLNVVPLFDSLEEGITLFCGEKYSSSSVTLPFLAKFLDLLKEDEADPTYVATFKDVLKEELITRCNDNLNFMMLAKCSIFDKCFSRLSFLTKLSQYNLNRISKEVVIEKIKQELELLVITAEDPNNDLNKKEPPKKKVKFLADEVDEGNEMQATVIDEFDKYLDEKALKPDDNPLLWWKVKKEIYPNVAKLARKYLCVQGSSTPAERVMSEMGNVF